MNTSHSGNAPLAAPWPATGLLAVVGSTAFMSGFFLLAAAGQNFDPPVYLMLLGMAAAVSLPILVLALLAAGSESILGRAWASGFRPLTGHERTARSASVRAVRYAGFLWLANGVALWFAALAAQL